MEPNKRIIVLFVFLLSMTFFIICNCSSNAFAEEKQSHMAITLPDGSVVPTEGLSNGEIQSLTTYLNKVAATQVKKAAKEAEEQNAMMNAVTESIENPEKLNEWRKLITGTIKDVCTDLNVSVNEFIKTPAGMTVTALIAYKVVGGEWLVQLMDIVLIVPFWIIFMGILFYLQRKYLGTTIIYHSKVEIQREGKSPRYEYSKPEVVSAYPWRKLKNGSENGSLIVFSIVLYASMILTTLICVCVAL